MNIPKELREDLERTALMLRMRAKAHDPLDCIELRQLVCMLLNMSEGKGALAPRPSSPQSPEGTEHEHRN